MPLLFLDCRDFGFWIYITQYSLKLTPFMFPMQAHYFFWHNVDFTVHIIVKLLYFEELIK
jgi:hypothetical protein